MADEDNTVVVAAEAPAASEPMDLMTALQHVLKKALAHDGLARGLRECVRALDRRSAFVCVLAENCDQPNYTALIQALCFEHSIPLVKVENSKELGEWVGLCKIDAEGKARKVVSCSCVVVRHYGEESEARSQLLAYLEAQKGK